MIDSEIDHAILEFLAERWELDGPAKAKLTPKLVPPKPHFQLPLWLRKEPKQ